jgi:hypothetical protein
MSLEFCPRPQHVEEKKIAVGVYGPTGEALATEWVWYNARTTVQGIIQSVQYKQAERSRDFGLFHNDTHLDENRTLSSYRLPPEVSQSSCIMTQQSTLLLYCIATSLQLFLAYCYISLSSFFFFFRGV